MDAVTNIYTALGGADPVQRWVARFFTLLQDLPELRALRQCYPLDVQPSRQALLVALTAWLGGPGASTTTDMTRPAAYGAVTDAVRQQWRWCMRRALMDTVTDPTLREGLATVLGCMDDHLILAGLCAHVPHNGVDFGG